MYSVIECGGFQHKVTLGETLKVSRITGAQVGSDLVIDKVLLHCDGDKVVVGAPLVDGSTVKVEVLSQGRADKIIVFKRKRRKRYRLTKGHRQAYTEVVVKEIAAGGSKSAVDEKVLVHARARIAALAKQKEQVKPLTRAQKVAAGIRKEGE